MTTSFDLLSDEIKQQWRDMRRRLVDHIDGRTADLCDDVLKVPSTVYTDQKRFEAEKAMFRELPLIACVSQDIPNPGDRLVFDAVGPSILIVRDEDMKVRAYLNMCPHRGSRLVDDCKNSDSLVCPFHAWRFDLKGELIRRPRDDAFDKPAPGLTPVPVEEWGGLIFVRATPGDEPINAEEYLGGMAPIIKGLEFDDAIPVKAALEVDVETNWKLNLDTFGEAYHVPSVHRPSFGGNVVPYVTVQDIYGYHGRYIGPAQALKDCVGEPESKWPDSIYSATHILFPNVSITMTDSIDNKTPMLTMFRLFPGETVGTSRCLMTSYIHKVAKDIDRTVFEEATDGLMKAIIDEDYSVACNTWKGLKDSSSNDIKFTLGRNEAVLQNAHRVLAEKTGMPLDPTVG